MEFDPELAIDFEKSLEGGAVLAPGWGSVAQKQDGYNQQLLHGICTQYGIPFHGVPFGELSQRQKEVILYGAPQGERLMLDYVNQSGHRRSYETVYELSLIHI